MYAHVAGQKPPRADPRPLRGCPVADGLAEGPIDNAHCQGGIPWPSYQTYRAPLGCAQWLNAIR